MFYYGPVVNAILFFVTGVPGGISYLLLVLVRSGRMAAMREKELSASINTWLRTPGLVFVATVMYCCMAHGQILTPTWAAVVPALLAATNGLCVSVCCPSMWTFLIIGLKC